MSEAVSALSVTQQNQQATIIIVTAEVLGSWVDYEKNTAETWSVQAGNDD